MREWWLRLGPVQQAGYVWAATMYALALVATAGWALIGGWR